MSEFNYLREKVRMLNSLGRTGGVCERVAWASCPLSVFNNQTGFQCNAFEMECPDKATAMVKKWAEEHPPKTVKQKFLEIYPNAQVNDEGYPIICVAVLDDNIECGSGYYCKECWDKEVDECEYNAEVDTEKLKKIIRSHSYPIRHGVNNIDTGMTVLGIFECIDRWTESLTNKDVSNE